MLPFLQTPAPQTPVPSASAQATPQIFTSNPLTALVNRIARFFRASSKAAPSAKPQLTDQQVKEQFGTPQGEPAYADARAAQNYISTEQTPSAGSARRFSNAYFQDDAYGATCNFCFDASLCASFVWVDNVAF